MENSQFATWIMIYDTLGDYSTYNDRAKHADTVGR
jgi:hypothetical protein